MDEKPQVQTLINIRLTQLIRERARQVISKVYKKRETKKDEEEIATSISDKLMNDTIKKINYKLRLASVSANTPVLAKSFSFIEELVKSGAALRLHVPETIVCQFEEELSLLYTNPATGLVCVRTIRSDDLRRFLAVEN